MSYDGEIEVRVTSGAATIAQDYSVEMLMEALRLRRILDAEKQIRDLEREIKVLKEIKA